MGGWGGWQSTFDAESSIDKIQITIFAGEGGGGQLLMQSPEMLKSKIPIFASWGGVGGQLLMLSPEMLKSNF